MLSSNILKRIAEAEMLNFGSGPSAYGFDYEAAGINGVNLAMTPSAFAMEAAFLRAYPDAFRRGTAAVFAVCPFSFGNNKDLKRPARFARYYPVLPKTAFAGIPEAVTHWDAVVAASMENEKYPLFPYKAERAEEPLLSDEELSGRVDSMCAGWKNELGLADFTDASQAEYHEAAFKTKREALNGLLSAAEQAGLRPFLFLPPLHPLLRKRISPEFFDAFVYRNLKGVNVPIFDYTQAPGMEREDFIGPIFLSRKGAAKLTREIYGKTRQ